MQVLRLLAARRGVATTITMAPTSAPEPADDTKAVAEEEEEEYDDDDDDEGSFFELDLSVRASSSSAGSASSGSSDDASLTDLDFVISLHRSRSASPSFHLTAPPLPLPLDLKPGSAGLRALSFAGATATTRNAAALYGGRRSSFARGSARSLRLFMESPLAGDDAEGAEEREPEQRRAPSRDVIRRYLAKLSMRLRRSVRPRRGGGGGGEGVVGLRRLRKSRSASTAVTAAAATTTAPPRRDDSLAEKQDGIASAIAHCKESLHRPSLSLLPMPDCGSPLPRSRSDPGNRQAP